MKTVDEIDHFSPFDPLSVDDIVQIARHYRAIVPIRHGQTQAARLEQSAAWVAATMREIESAETPHTYYGINTGFGDNAGRVTFRDVREAERLSRNLLLSHNVGVGEHLPEDVVRAALAIRIGSLAQGYSGVRIEVINALIAMLNARVYPAVPAQGSLGASGDLAPLAHLVIPISAPLPDEPPDLPGATGYCYLAGELVTGAEAMREAGIERVRLGAKEGVALINGTAVSTAIGALALYDAQQIIAAEQITVALTVEAMRGFRDAFLPHANVLRSPFQAEVAAVVRGYLQNSTFARGAIDLDLDTSEGPPQDAYSIRCAPVVLGAALHALYHVNAVLTDELYAVTDNPLIFADPDPYSADHLPRRTKVISGGNFHGAPVGYAMDYLALVLTDVASIAERRIFLLTDPRLNRGLPPFLTAESPGLNSGLMIAQYTAAALVSECKALAHPASVDSIPSSANREDHVSMSTVAARKAAQIVGNVRKAAALELLCALQAVWLRQAMQPEARLGDGTARAVAFAERLNIAPNRTLGLIRDDVPLTPYVEALDRAIQDGSLIEAVKG